MPYKRVDVELGVVNPEKGPISIESYYHRYTATIEVLQMIQKAEREKYDAVIIACFGDPGLEAARELVHIPVIGIAEASILLASMLGHKFSIIVILRCSIPRAERYVRQLGLSSKLASIREIGMGIVELERNREEAEKLIMEKCRRVIEQDGAEVIVLGCAGMSGLAKRVRQELMVPVIDPTIAALKMAEGLVDMGLSQSKVALYGEPSSTDIKK